MSLEKLKQSVLSCLGGGLKSSIFGHSLESLHERHHGEPVFLRIAIDFLLQRGLDETRIFRDAPDKRQYDALVRQLEDGDMIDEARTSPLMMAWFLREFLSKLPTPLIPSAYAISQRLLDAIDVQMPSVFVLQAAVLDAEHKKEGLLDELLYIKSVVMSLKSEHFALLRTVIHLFAAICAAQSAMDDAFEALDAHHLAQIFGPILVAPASSTSSSKRDRSRTLHLSQDLVLFLVNHFHDIFERNTFKELLAVHRQNRELRREHADNEREVHKLERIRESLTYKLCASHYASRLSSRCFLSWKAGIPRNQSERKQFLKINQLVHSLEASKQVIHKQARRIKALETKLELTDFDRRLTGSASIAIHQHMLVGNRSSSVIGGGNQSQMGFAEEYLRKSMMQIANLRQWDESLTKSSSLRNLRSRSRSFVTATPN